MNKLDLSALGGEPLAADDFEFLQTSLADAINGLGGITELSVVVIQGIVISPPSFGFHTYTAGWVYILGELYYVPAGIFAASPAPYFVVVTADDPNGAVTYENATTQNIYKLRTVAIQATGSGPSTHLISNIKYLKDFWVKSLGEAWQAPAYTTDWMDYFGLTFPDPVMFKKNDLGEVVFKGSVQSQNNGTTLANSIAFTLPLAYRPNRIIQTKVDGNGTNGFLEVWVYPDGNVEIYGPASSFKTGSLNGLRFHPV